MIAKKNNKILFVFIVILIASVLILAPFYPNSLKDNKLVIVPRGSTYSVAEVLQTNSIIYNARIFFYTAQVMKLFGGSIKAGEYDFERNSSTVEIIRKMQRGDVFIRKITVPEGYTNKQIIDLIKAEDKLAGNIAITYNEGELLPETYFYTYGDSREYVLLKMHNAMMGLLDNLWENRDKELNLKTKQEALILASIVEREAKTDEDRLKIASVFLNRLKKGMKLEADPTTIYAITKGEYVLDRSLTKNDLKLKSPFNTYFSVGLPPQPIANPGLKALKSVINPVRTDYLYFVVGNCDGGHNFSATNTEHNKNVVAYRKLKCS